MKLKMFISALIIVLCFESYAQIVFENGYFIDESNSRIECLIRNVDWRSNPTKFEYKHTANGEVQQASIQTVREFEIYGISKFVRAKVNIDRSSDVLANMSTDYDPNFSEELLFLRVLIEGQATLFSYIDGILTRFFFSLDNNDIEQLVFKKYLVDKKVAENHYFKHQLFLNLKCEDIVINDLQNLKYNRRHLERLFIKYNNCTNTDYVSFRQKIDFFNFSIKAGLNFSSLEIFNSSADLRDTDFGSKVGVKVGVEAEFILPFNKNKWGIYLEPTYRYFTSEKSKTVNNVSGGLLVTKVDYKSVELPIGVRHNFYLEGNLIIFLNLAYVVDFSNSSIELIRNDGSLLQELKIKTTGKLGNFATGVGLKYKDRYSVELRYFSNRDILFEHLYWKAYYKSVNMVFGVSIY